MVSPTEHDQRWFYLLGPISNLSKMQGGGRCRFRSAALVKTLSKSYCLGNEHPNLQTRALELNFPGILNGS